MKIFKNILFILLGIVVLMLIIGIFVPNTFHAGAKIKINRPSDTIFNYVKMIKNQHNFDAWSAKDPNIVQSYQGEDGTVGFIYEWKSKEVGDGKQIITNIENGKRVEMDLYFNGSDQANKSFMQVDSISLDQSNITWEIDGKVPYPFNVITLFYNMDNDFQTGLENLKKLLEE